MAAVIAVALPAAAAGPGAQLRVLDQSAGTLKLALVTPGSSAARLDPESVQVTIAAEPVSATVDGARAASQQISRRAVLVIDTSGSMAGNGLAGAKHAARQFLRRVPADVQVGLVAFADRPRQLVSPTTSRAPLAAAVDSLTASGETSLYDAVSVATAELGDAGRRTLIVLSDGADTRSAHSLASVTAQLRLAHVQMDAIALHTGDAVRRALLRLAGATGGTVSSASNATQLASAFGSAAAAFDDELIVRASVPASAAGTDVEVVVRATGSIGDVTATTHVRLSGRPAVATSARRKAASTSRSVIPTPALVALFVGLALLCYQGLAAVTRATDPGTQSKRLLDRYTVAQAQRTDTHGDSPRRSPVLHAILAVAGRYTQKQDRHRKLDVALSRADVGLRPNEWICVRAGVAFAAALLGLLLFRSALAAVIVGAVGYALSGLWLTMKGRRRLRAFEEHLPPALQLVASGVRSGFSLAQALDGVVREGMEPVATEMNRALTEARLAVPLEDALDNVAARMDSEDFRWVAMAIRIQREVGGNLAEVLLNTATMMRDRIRLRRQVKALSAEGRLSAYVLLALPIFMSLYMIAFRRAYLRPLYTQPAGIGMLVTGVVLLLVGVVWMRKTVDVEL